MRVMRLGMSDHIRILYFFVVSVFKAGADSPPRILFFDTKS